MSLRREYMFVDGRGATVVATADGRVTKAVRFEVVPVPGTTEPDGGRPAVGGEVPDVVACEPYDKRRFDNHLRNLRAGRGVTWQGVVEAFGMDEEEAAGREEFIRSLFP